MTDLLQRAAQALRESSQQSPAPAELTRSRIMASLHRDRRRRHTRIARLIPIAAVLVGSTAWAMAGHRWPALWQSIRSAVTHFADSPEKLETKPQKSTRTPAAKRGAVPESSVSGLPEPVEPPAAPEVETPKSSESVVPKAGASIAPVAPRPQRAIQMVDPGEALYRTAHTAHFVDREPALALKAWDAYLARSPNGRFAPEARYNRALCLVRLERIAEAGQALLPFARGAHGSYRCSEARALLTELKFEVGGGSCK